MAHFLYGSSSTHATTDMQLIKHSREVVSVRGAEIRKTPLPSHVGAIAMFSRRVPWQRKGRIQRLKQPESAEVVHGTRKNSMLLLLRTKAENKLFRGPIGTTTWAIDG